MGCETVMVVDGQGGYRLRLRKANVDPDPAATILPGLYLAPIRDAGALGTEVKAEPLVPPRIDTGGPGNLDPFIVEFVSPERTIAAANGAVAGSDRFRYSLEAPADSPAVTHTFNHGFRRSEDTPTSAGAGQALTPAVPPTHQQSDETMQARHHRQHCRAG